MGPGTALITGSTGLLGQGLLATAPVGWSVVTAQRRREPVDAPGIVPSAVDVRSRPSVEALFTSSPVDVVVHAAGIASVDFAEQHIQESLESNLTGTRNVAELCRDTGARLVFVSTNAVFDGTSAPYGEGDSVHPVNAYGRVKVECEHLVRDTLDDFVIVRPILMYGWPHARGRPNVVTWVIDELSRGRTLHVVDDVFENPLYNVQAGQAIWAILSRDIRDIVHLAGSDVVSRYKLACQVARVFDLDASRIVRVASSFFPDLAPRPRDTSFRTERMSSELAMAPLSCDEGLRLMAAHGPARG